MVSFVIKTAGVKPLLALIAAHGLTDLDTHKCVVPYAIATAVPLPTEVVTLLFCGASVAHFSNDIGKRGSLLVHGAVLAAGLHSGVQAAFKLIILYLFFFHTPIHFVRCFLRKRQKAALGTLAVTLLAMVLSPKMGETVILNDFMQRVATAHIITEARMCKGDSVFAWT